MMVNQFTNPENTLSVLRLYHVGITSVFSTDRKSPTKVNRTVLLTYMRQSINQFLMQATRAGAVS